jgi:PASTA domain
MRPILPGKLACALVAAAATAACAMPAFGKPPSPPFTPPSGTLAICNTSDARSVTGSFSYTLTALASAGGTQVLTVPVGTCTSKIFYNQGAAVTVTETVPPGDSVAAIALTGDTTSSASSNLAAGSAVVTVGSGQATLTFQTNGPLQHCVVPSVVWLTLTAAATSLRKHSCRPGAIHRAYSKAARAGHVISQTPKRGTTLAPNVPVALVLSRGPRP